MNDYSHLRLHEARTHQSSRAFHATSLHTGRRRSWMRRLLGTPTRDTPPPAATGDARQLTVAAPDSRAASA
jgi:hypothetical protein